MKKSWFLAVLISLAIIGSAFAAVGNSQAITPQTGSVNFALYYEDSTGGIGHASSNTTVTLSNFGGSFSQTQTGNTPSFTGLNYGQYNVTVAPTFTLLSNGTYVISSGSKVPVDINTNTQTVTVNLPVQYTKPVSVTISPIASGTTASVSFVSLSGFTFEKFNNVNGSAFSAYLPSGQFFVNVNYPSANAKYTLSENLQSSQNSLNINLAQKQIYGTVTNTNGQLLSPISVVVLNTATGAYTVTDFNSASYTIVTNNTASNVVVITSPGYAPAVTDVSSASLPFSPQLSKDSSSVYYNYSVSQNLQYVNVTATFNVDNSTALPYFNNSNVGSFYWQAAIDHLSGASISSYISHLFNQYTNNEITVAGYNYNRTSSGTPTVSMNSASNGFTGSVSAVYYNANVPTSVYNNDFNINVYALGTQSMPGSLNYHYSVAYANSSISLKSSTAPVQTEISPIVISPVSSNQWITLTMSKSQPPAFVDSQIALNWNGMVSSNYVLNSSATNTAFVVPTNTPVSLNLSNAYFNPVTGQKDYLNPNNNFTWKVGSTVIGYSYNITHTFTTSQTVTIDVTSASGVSNTTSFMVYVNNANPSVKYSVLLGGKTVASGTSATASVSVPQSALVTFSAYGSSSTVGGYQIPLTYAWSFPGFASAALNATHSFSVPSVSAGVQSGTLTVTSVTGQSASATFAVTVNDTTPSNAVVSLYNLNNTAVTSPTVGKGTVFSANGTTDPYYTLSTQSYNWTVLYQNGTHAVEGSATYNVVGGSLNNSSYVILKFNTVDSMVVSLKVTNPAGVVAYNNKTVSMVVDSPRLVVNSVYIGHNLTQGSKATVYVNISNVGTQDAPSFQITLYINNNVVATNTYNNLSAGQSKNVSFSWTPSSSGSVTLEFRGNTSLEPASFPAIGSYTTTVNIKPPAYTTALIIGGVIAVIVIVGFIYYRLSSGRTKKPKQKPAAKQPKQKTEPKKTPEKKK